MPTEQQEEALNYFRKKAKEWDRKAKLESVDEVNVIKQRNDFVLDVIDQRRGTDFFLDVACGNGDLVCFVEKKGINSLGVDFSKEMIEIAVKNAGEKKCENAKFECCSIFDFSMENEKYDVISANGFIEYISFKKFNDFLDISIKGLKKGGSLILSSRNRLFNVFSLNNYTKEEIDDGFITDLILEGIKLVNISNINELIGFKTTTLQDEHKKHLKTGIEVSTRYQYTPIQLVNILHSKGLKPVEVVPIHIHGVLPKFKDKYPKIHSTISNLLQKYYKKNYALLPQASSFMIHVKRV